MKHALTLAALLATLAGPAQAGNGFPPVKPADCSGLVQARAQARAAAAPLAYDVFEFDGDQAHTVLQSQDTPAALMVDHVTVLLNPRSGRAVMLLNDGPACAFGSIATIDAKNTSPLETAINTLRFSR